MAVMSDRRSKYQKRIDEINQLIQVRSLFLIISIISMSYKCYSLLKTIIMQILRYLITCLMLSDSIHIEHAYIYIYIYAYYL